MHQAAGLFIPHPVVQFSPSSPAEDCLGTASKAGATYQPTLINFRRKCARAIALLCYSCYLWHYWYFLMHGLTVNTVLVDLLEDLAELEDLVDLQKAEETASQ